MSKICVVQLKIVPNIFFMFFFSFLFLWSVIYHNKNCEVSNFQPFQFFLNFHFVLIFNFVPIFNFSPIFNFVHFVPNFNFFPNHQFCSILTILSRAVDWNFQSCFTACLQILWFVIFPSKRFNSTRKKTYGRKTSRLWQMWLSLQHCRITPHAHCSSPRRSNLTPNSRVWNMWKKFSRCLHFERTHFDTFGHQEIHLWHLWQAIKKWFMLPKTHDEYSWTKNLLWPLQQRL